MARKNTVIDRPGALWTMQEHLRRGDMQRVILLTQGGEEFPVHVAKRVSPIARRFQLKTRLGGDRGNPVVKFVMTVRDSGIIINRESGDPADNIGDARVTGFRIRGDRKGSWSLGRSDG